jgi:hypothetical protein
MSLREDGSMTEEPTSYDLLDQDNISRFDSAKRKKRKKKKKKQVQSEE